MRRSSQSLSRKSNNRKGRLRLFFALWPPEAVARDLHAWAAAVHAKAEAALAGSGGRVTRESTIHMTLAFLGDLPDDRVASLIECGRRVRAAPIDLTLDEGRWWKHNQVVCAGPRRLPEALGDLVAQLESRLKDAGFEIEAREFRAHVTLVRRASIAAEGLPPLERSGWRAAEFVLVSSVLTPQGPDYRILARFALMATNAR